MALTTLPTEYQGIVFRSRTEARWAVFFDILKLQWQYEPEGFDLPAIGDDDDGIKCPIPCIENDGSKYQMGSRLLAVIESAANQARASFCGQDWA